MNNLIDLWDKPAAGKYMIAGWHQWADAGDISSGLPQYLLEHTGARKIGQIKPYNFYLFQIPGTHHLLRPVVKLAEGHAESLERRRNEFFYTGDDEKGFLIFLGEEPHQNEDGYAAAFFDAVEELGVRKVATVAGVYGAMPYDKDRNVSCVYSLPRMKDKLSRYAVKFSDYEGGATISMYLAHEAEAREIEFFRFCAYVPSYDFSKLSTLVQPVSIDRDFKAWYDVMIRLDHMFGLALDLSDLEKRSDKLISEWDAKIAQVERTMPQLEVKEYMKKVSAEFSEMSFEPLSDVWAEALGDLFDEL
jgi:predicted ATP-grasp superfamily ATP-dependent carboligase